jgi:hypothetical protein
VSDALVTGAMSCECNESQFPETPFDVASMALWLRVIKENLICLFLNAALVFLEILLPALHNYMQRHRQQQREIFPLDSPHLLMRIIKSSK